jgi:GalNAc-alpha-(1->4)-GalNAc-alpha-(1->3)-diNAcBac-PP-undecaprenol alpha-1,4-N-acetyl-D-galactosaminyltransferase
MRLTFVINALGTGGAERVVVNLAHEFIRRGYAVSVVTVSREFEDFYPLPASVTRIALDHGGEVSGLPGKLRATVQRLRDLRRAVVGTRPDVVVSFLDVTNITTQIALLGTGLPVIVSEHSHPVHQPIRSRRWDRLRRWIYPRSVRLVSVSHAIDAEYGWLPPEKRAVIHNPLPPELPDGEPVIADSTRAYVVAMGRLVALKGFDLLIQAFAQLADDFPAWDLVILGDGPRRDDLTAQITAAGLADRVHLPGRVPNPFPTLRQAQIFVLSSRNEGFGNVLIEAMACGCPPVSFDCPGGPAEIITHEVDGLLVPPEDVSALAGALRGLMQAPARRAELAQNAERASTRWSLSAIGDQWETLFRAEANRRPAIDDQFGPGHKT